jgi:Spy/CpxP family protein refolding chaperone
MRTLVVGLLVAAAAVAQGPMMTPWWESPIVRDLNLSEEQHRKIRSTVSGSRGKIILLRATLEAAESDLGELMGEDPVDPKKGSAAIDKVLAARTDLGRQVAQMSLALRQILSASQWHELERRQRRGPNQPNQPRFNGPGPGQGRNQPPGPPPNQQRFDGPRPGEGPNRPNQPQPQPPPRKQD